MRIYTQEERLALMIEDRRALHRIPEHAYDLFKTRAYLRERLEALHPDVLESCDIHGASDASIRNPVPNDIASIIRYTYIHKIYTTGTTAYKLYNKLIKPQIKKEAILLPSPSPANARMSLENLIDEYKQKLDV